MASGTSPPSQLVTVKKEGTVFILTMNAGENRFNNTFMAALNQALDTVESRVGEEGGGGAVVLTSSDPKFFSNGLDLPYVMANPDFVPTVIEPLFARFLNFPLPTVAAVNGHAFAGGFMLALAHDIRVMRKGRGFLCLNEIELGIPLTPGMTALISSKLSGRVLRDAVLQARRFSAEEAEKLEIVDKAVEADDLLKEAIAIAAKWGAKVGDKTSCYSELKEGLYKEAKGVLTAKL